VIRRPSLSSTLILLVAGIIGAITLLPGIGGPVDRVIDPLRFAVRNHAASGSVVVVEMDAASVAAIQTWPWPRRHYAQVIDTLRKAGAASIVFDVDFSSHSIPADDRAMAEALKRASGLVTLPTFAQAAGGSDVRSLDALPIAPFRDDVAMASVSIAPDVDGIIRSMPLATLTAGTPRPSLSAYIAGRSGSVDQPFPIDMSIDPSTIPRLSFVAIRDGRFDPLAVRGKNVLIGTTAVEMGDRYAVPRWGVLPGVVIQALAAETLIDGIPSEGSALVPAFVAVLLGIILLWRVGTFGTVATALGAIVALITVVLIAQYGLRIDYPMASALGTVGTVALGCVIRDVARQFRRQRQTDDQTGMPNRVAFLQRSSNHLVDIVVVQINNIDAITAVLGVDELKHVLIRTAERLKLASTDHQVYRVRGHHLAFVMATDQPLEDMMAALRNVLVQPLEVGGRRVDVHVSVGTAGGADPGRLLTDAALAAEQAHATNCFWMRAETDHGRLERAVSLMSDLDDAMMRNHIEVYYQPKLALMTNTVTSVEALVRWRDPERGFIGPDQFIPLAEQTGRIDALTLHILGIVLRDVADWRQRGHEVAAGINISATLLASRAFNDAIEGMLQASPVPASALIFEVTESAAMTDPDGAAAALRRYRALGIAVSMDDYGTGQSTLSYLQKLPLNELKIDRSFVQHAHSNENDAILVRSTIDLAHSLGLKVVAEGIEDEECLSFLRNNGCDLAQGYFISRPIPLPSLLNFLAKDSALAA